MRQVSWRESLREASMTRDSLTQTEGDALITVVLHRFVRHCRVWEAFSQRSAVFVPKR